MQSTQLISIIRNSLNAATSAAVMLENLACGAAVTSTGACAAACPSYENVMDTIAGDTGTTPAPTQFELLMAELNDPRYTMRSTNELSAKTGIGYHNIGSVLAENGVRFVTKTRRSDSAQLIGLAARNGVEPTPFEKLMAELNDPRYKLRSINELAEKTGLDGFDDITDELDDNDVEYTTRVRRGDGATLIGLAERQ